MKKLILFFMFFLSLTLLYAQKETQTLPNENEHNLSPNGLFDKVFDHYGNNYKLSDVLIGQEVRGDNNQIVRSTNPAPMTCGYYDLYFETGSGMEDISNPIHVERRNVLCRVLTDLSNFINSPLTTNGLNNKVNIWVRNINNVITAPESPNGVLGLASSFYTMPYNNVAGFGGIVDNEIWKTIHLGRDSYTNVVSPLMSTGISVGQSGIFYHGMMAFNFSDSAISWNTDLTVTSFPNNYDLYTVILHEMTHALGFASLLNSNGLSKFGTGYNYFSRYDTRLKNNPNTQFLINKQTNACGSMYNYVFNNAINTSVLQPTSNACNNKVRYVGLSNVPVHTPTAFSPPSSLSHFEGVCVSPNPSFVMESAIGMNVIRRFLKPQERNVLGDLGYSVNTSYGVSTTYQGTTTYTGALSGINVAGMNDGISSNGVYTYINNANTNIQIVNILSNDTNATGFECLEDIYYPSSSLSTTSGNTSTIINFSSSEEGLHLLRYVPINGSQKGNLSYIYIYVINNTNCAIPSTCNLVLNGDFEQFSSIPNNFGQVSNACGWINASLGSPDYCHADTPLNWIGVPCNDGGGQADNIISNKGYVRFYDNANVNNNNTLFSENFVTKLATPLQPNTEYQLSFDVSLIEGVSRFRMKSQAYLSTTLSISSGYYIPISNPQMLFVNPTYSNISDGWERIIFTIPARPIAGEQYLYLGALLKAVSPLTDPNVEPNCNYNLTPLPYPGQSFTSTGYYLDNVSLIPLDFTITLPENICLNESINDLSNYLNAVPFSGTFSGNGVTGNTFNATVAGIGVHTIAYTYTNSSGCSVTIYSQIEVLSLDDPDCSNNCPDNLIFSSTESSTLITYNTSNFIETNTNYLVNSASDVTLKAGNFIVIKPESQINSGSQFFARIENCDGSQTGKMSNTFVKTTKKSKPKPFSENNRSSDSIESFEISGLIIYPNPSKDLINITTSLNAELQINIFDMLGKEVVNAKVSDNKLNVSFLTSGVYIIKINEEGKTASRKLVIN